jgi:hypothetical protein
MNAPLGLDDVLRSLISAPAQIDPDALHKRSWNAAVDKVTEVVAEWVANGRDPETLFDRLQDLKIWTR